MELKMWLRLRYYPPLYAKIGIFLNFAILHQVTPLREQAMGILTLREINCSNREILGGLEIPTGRPKR